MIDAFLQSGRYATKDLANQPRIPIDVTRYGLIFIDIDDDTSYSAQYEAAHAPASVALGFDNTTEILRNLYLAGDKDDLYFGNAIHQREHISGVSFNIETAYLGATTKIWNHIKNKRQPVVAFVNSGKTLFYIKQEEGIVNNSPPTEFSVHYVVIAGIKDDIIEKEFYIYDPLELYGQYWLSGYELADCMDVRGFPKPDIPYWLSDYAMMFNANSYYMLVEGD
jgi:hypothetical protein